MNAIIRPATDADFPFLTAHDRHIAPEELRRAIADGRILLAVQEGKPAGWLRWNLFWDNTPFMNLLYLLDGFRGQGLGRLLVSCWEEQMRRAGHALLMTSTQANEPAQLFYRHLGYRDVGGFMLPGEPYELILIREI